MATPKSKKPSPLISTNSPKVAVWQQCKKCLIYLNQKDNGLHMCQDLMQMKHPFILDNALYAFIETTNGIDNQNINADNLVLMSLSAIQLCKFQIGESVQLSDVKSKTSVAKLVWPTCAKSLLTVQVTEHVLQYDLKLSSGDPVSIRSLVHIPQPLSQVYLHCSNQIDQYESLALITAVGSQLRSKLIHCDQTVTIIFYGIALSFTVQKVVPCQDTTLIGQSPGSPITSTTTDSITEHFQTLSLIGNQMETVTGPNSNQIETVTSPSGNQKDTVSSLSGNQKDTVSTPSCNQMETVTSPSGNQKDTVSSLNNNQIETVTSPSGNQKDTVSSPINNQKESNQFRFYKIVNSTKFVITNYKSKLNEKQDNGGAVYRMENIGGLDQIVTDLVSILNVSLGLSPSIQGMKKSNGVLIHGVNGTGKTSLIQCLACHMKVTQAEIHVADLFSKFYGEAESRLKSSFDFALDHAPSLLLLDNLDVLCSGKNRSDQERRLISCLVSQIDRLHELQASVVLLAVTTSLDNVDIQLRTPGRLDQEIELPVPSREQRDAILNCLLSRVPHSLSSEQIQGVAFVTHGFVGADLAALISSAATATLLASKQGTKSEGDISALRADKEGTNTSTRLSYEQVTSALDQVKPSAMRQVLVEVPNVKWTDIGGQDEVKLKLRQSVEWPLKHPEAFQRLGIAPPRGILLFGPPGCSKTMIAKALATESKLNFISVKGPELFRKYVGESERSVRDVFKRARQVSPSVIFFDELDALAGERGDGGGGGGGSNVQERVLAQMLTEMDGIVPLNNVTIVAATNRPDRIDKALLRPGRLDRLIYVPLPDEKTREAILNLRLSRSPLGDDVSVGELVQSTQGYSGAEIVAVCDEAALCALENNLDAACVMQQDFMSALQLVKPRTPQNLLNLYEKYVKN